MKLDLARALMMVLCGVAGSLSLVAGLGYVLLESKQDRVGKLGVWHIGLAGLGFAVMCLGMACGAYLRYGQKFTTPGYLTLAGLLCMIVSLVLIVVHVRNLESS